MEAETIITPANAAAPQAPLPIPPEYVGQDGKILGRFANVQELFDAVGKLDAPATGVAQSTGNLFPNHQGSAAPVTPTAAGTPATPAPSAGFQIGAPAAPVAPTGLTPEYMASLGQEVVANGGKLTDASYTKLQGMGVSREAVDMHIAGQMALRQASQMQVESALGGRAKIDEAINWARANMTADQIQQIDRDLATASPAGQENILRGLMARGGISQGTIQGTSAQPQSAQPFRSLEEKAEAFSDPRYDTSAQYRADLERRLKATAAVGYVS